MRRMSVFIATAATLLLTSVSAKSSEYFEKLKGTCPDYGQGVFDCNATFAEKDRLRTITQISCYFIMQNTNATDLSVVVAGDNGKKDRREFYVPIGSESEAFDRVQANFLSEFDFIVRPGEKLYLIASANRTKGRAVGLTCTVFGIYHK